MLIAHTHTHTLTPTHPFPFSHARAALFRAVEPAKTQKGVRRAEPANPQNVVPAAEPAAATAAAAVLRVGESAVGALVARDFGAGVGVHKGRIDTVRRVGPSTKRRFLYHVLYEDGDGEDFNEGEYAYALDFRRDLDNFRKEGGDRDNFRKEGNLDNDTEGGGGRVTVSPAGTTVSSGRTGTLTLTRILALTP